jgi:hypothetical protein
MAAGARMRLYNVTKKKMDHTFHRSTQKMAGCCQIENRSKKIAQFLGGSLIVFVVFASLPVGGAEAG